MTGVRSSQGRSVTGSGAVSDGVRDGVRGGQ